MKIRAAILSAFLLLPLPMLADTATNTTYIYTGSNFTIVQAPYTTSDKVTGSFTLPTLGPNLVDARIDVDVFDFTDGIHTFEGQYMDIGQIWTDSTGAIDGWVIFLGNEAPGCIIEGGTAHTAPQPGDQCVLNTNGGAFGENCTGGSWTSVTTPVPEPSSFILSSASLLVSAFVVRKKAQHSSAH